MTEKPGLKGQFTQKRHLRHLLTLEFFQTGMSFFLLLNIKKLEEHNGDQKPFDYYFEQLVHE